jgi:hypothetical protein
MGFFRWFYQNIFQREYPLIFIPKFTVLNVPHISWRPTRISLCFSKRVVESWEINEDNIVDITFTVLEHEYLHDAIKKVVGQEATHKFNNVNRFERESNQLLWAFRDGKTFGHLCRQPI